MHISVMYKRTGEILAVLFHSRCPDIRRKNEYGHSSTEIVWLAESANGI